MLYECHRRYSQQPTQQKYKQRQADLLSFLGRESSHIEGRCYKMHGRKFNVLNIIHVAALLASCSVIEVQADNFLRSNPGSTNIKRADTSDLISSKTIPTNGSTPPGEIHRYMVKYKPNSMEYKTRLSNARRKMTASRRSLKVSGADTMFIPQDDIEVMNFESEAEVMEWRNKPDVEVVVRGQ